MPCSGPPSSSGRQSVSIQDAGRNTRTKHLSGEKEDWAGVPSGSPAFPSAARKSSWPPSQTMPCRQAAQSCRSLRIHTLDFGQRRPRPVPLVKLHLDRDFGLVGEVLRANRRPTLLARVLVPLVAKPLDGLGDVLGPHLVLIVANA